MNLLELSKSIESYQENNSIIIYGPPKSGKTRLAATISKVPQIKRVFWFDLENGEQTLFTMVRTGLLTPEEAAKITIFRVRDLPGTPRAYETIMKSLTVRKDQTICDAHGKVNCVPCQGKGTSFNIANCSKQDVIVIDSGSQLGDSILNYFCLGKGDGFKPGWDEYGPQVRELANALSVVQQADTNFIIITHEISLEGDDGKERFYPLMGTKVFSMKCAKYFGHVIYMHIKTKSHVAGSSTLYKSETITGSRAGWVIENEAQADFSLLFDRLKKELEVIPTATK